jgi:hypothetical protein
LAPPPLPPGSTGTIGATAPADCVEQAGNCVGDAETARVVQDPLKSGGSKRTG